MTAGPERPLGPRAGGPRGGRGRALQVAEGLHPERCDPLPCGEGGGGYRLHRSGSRGVPGPSCSLGARGPPSFGLQGRRTQPAGSLRGSAEQIEKQSPRRRRPPQERASRPRSTSIGRFGLKPRESRQSRSSLTGFEVSGLSVRRDLRKGGGGNREADEGHEGLMGFRKEVLRWTGRRPSGN